jgi:hypothetical protein
MSDATATADVTLDTMGNYARYPFLSPGAEAAGTGRGTQGARRSVSEKPPDVGCSNTPNSRTPSGTFGCARRGNDADGAAQLPLELHLAEKPHLSIVII